VVSPPTPAAEEEAVAVVHDAEVRVGQEVEGDGRVGGPWYVGEREIVGGMDGHLVILAVEEAGQGFGELTAVLRLGYEVAPGPGDALAAADGPEGEAGEDLDDEVVGEAGGRRAALRRHLS
jgi:hypothetical protein